eukprot:scaffold59842_cov59-Cyclotella_meneghiniana.AAC.1
MKRLMTNVFKFRWNVPELRDRQRYSLCFIFHNKASGGTALLVDCTGGGKSHTMRCSGVFMRGIVLIIVPLLALAADVFLKFVTDKDKYGPVQAIHFDEDIGDDQSLRRDLISNLKEVHPQTKRTVFPFISPQRLHQHRDLQRCLLARHTHTLGVLRNVMINEFHLFCQHGIDFRKEIREICNSFIRVLMERRRPPYLLLCTAKCSVHNIEAFCRMTGVNLRREHHIWSDPADFRQQNITMKLELSSKYKQSMCKLVEKFLERDSSGCFIIYTGTAHLAKDVHKALRTHLNSSDNRVDVLLVHGSQSALEKFQYTRAFTSTSTRLTNAGVNLRGFVGTSAIDAGLDHPTLYCEGISQLPRDMQSYVQRRGRVGRDGRASECLLCISLDDFMYTATQILKDHHPQPHNSHLPPTEQAFVCHVKYDEFMTLCRFVSLRQGCWHCKIESFCSRGYLVNNIIPINLPLFPPCKTSCPHCTGAIDNYFCPIYVMGLIHFFDSDYSSQSFPMSINDKNHNTLVDLVWNNEVAVQLIFDQRPGTIKQYHVEGLMLQLFSVGVLQFTHVKKDSSGLIILAREKGSLNQFNQDRYKRKDVYKFIATMDECKTRK